MMGTVAKSCGLQRAKSTNRSPVCSPFADSGNLHLLARTHLLWCLDCQHQCKAQRLFGFTRKELVQGLMKMDAVTCQLAVQMFNPQVTIHAFSPKIKTLMLANPNGKRMLAEPALWATNRRERILCRAAPVRRLSVRRGSR